MADHRFFRLTMSALEFHHARGLVMDGQAGGVLCSPDVFSGRLQARLLFVGDNKESLEESRRLIVRPFFTSVVAGTAGFDLLVRHVQGPHREVDTVRTERQQPRKLQSVEQPGHSPPTQGGHWLTGDSPPAACAAPFYSADS